MRGRRDVLIGTSVARPPHKRCAGPSRHFSRPDCRESPAEPPCGADATFFSALPSRIPRTSTVRGRCDTPRALTVARPPQDRSAGRSRPYSRHFRRETPAYRLCGGLATSPRSAPVVKPPHKRRAGRSRRSSRHFRRESPAYRLCGAVATLLAPRPSQHPRIPAVRGRCDTPSAPHAAPVLCQFVRICLNSLKSSTLLAGSPMQATLGKGQL